MPSEGHFYKNKYLLKEAAKTLRKLPLFGYADYQVDFEWPTPWEVMEFPADQQIAPHMIKWKQSTKYIVGIQMLLSNGI